MISFSFVARGARALVLASAVAAVAAAPAKAQLIDFEGAQASQLFVPQGYAGFDWLGGFGATSWVNGSFGGPSLNHPVSGTNSIWSNGGTNLTMKRTGGGTFDLGSVWLANSYFNPGQVSSLTITGYLANNLVYSQTVSLLDATMQKFTLGFTGVDYVDFGQNGGNVTLDDIYIGAEQTAVPEPASIALFATGLAGVVGFSRRRRTQA